MILEDSYVKFLIEHNLTQGQYLLLHLVHKGRPDLIRAYKEAFPSEDSTMIGQYFIDDLIKKGFVAINAQNKPVLTKQFLEIFINKHTACEEIFSIYPTHFMKDGVQIPLSAMDRNVFANLYDKAILSSTLEHLEIMQDIDYAIKEEMLNIGIDKFLKSKYWMVIRPKRLAHVLKEQTKMRKDHNF